MNTSASTAIADRQLDWQENIAGLERWGSLAAGSVAILYGLSRRSRAGALLAAAGTTLFFRGATGHCPVYSKLGVTTARSSGDTRVALGGERGIHVHESIRLEKPLEEVYGFWRQIENLPRFMSNLERVTDLGNGRSHWVAKGPAGTSVEWDAEIINEIENKVIGWRSLPDSRVVTAGSVNFDRVRQGRTTQVSVNLQYAPPAGRAGALVAGLFSREPSQTIREDLRRFKQLLEAGEVPVSVPGSSENGSAAHGIPMKTGRRGRP
jgi:uncharacterized membrane protein